MKTAPIFTAIGALALAGAATLAAVSSAQDAPKAAKPAFDPLFANSASCTPARAGRPPLLDRLVLAQAETAPFKPGQLDAAEQVFRDSLARIPSNGWALCGLIEVYQKRGDSPALAAAQKRFETTWLGERGGPPLARL